MYNCECCNYSTTLHSNYKKHLKTKKHLVKNTDTKSKSSNICSNSEIESKKVSNKYLCDACDILFSSKSNLTRHKKVCVDQKYKHEIILLKERLKHKDEIIKIQRDTIVTLRENIKTMNIEKETDDDLYF